MTMHFKTRRFMTEHILESDKLYNLLIGLRARFPQEVRNPNESVDGECPILFPAHTLLTRDALWEMYRQGIELVQVEYLYPVLPSLKF